ncbi:MAG: GNAT family N-acetyltransferase [Syntrophales bacterium]
MENAPILMKCGGYGLRRLVMEDANSTYLGWISDPEINCFLTVGKFPAGLDDLKSYILGFEGNRNAMAFAIVHLEKDKHIGNTTINAINWISGTADLGMMIGDREYLNRGCAYYAWSMVIKHAFNSLGLRRLYAGVLEGNRECLEAAVKLGLTQEGRWRKHSLVKGTYMDEIWFAVLKEEFPKLNLGDTHE